MLPITGRAWLSFILHCLGHESRATSLHVLAHSAQNQLTFFHYFYDLSSQFRFLFVLNQQNKTMSLMNQKPIHISQPHLKFPHRGDTEKRGSTVLGGNQHHKVMDAGETWILWRLVNLE